MPRSLLLIVFLCAAAAVPASTGDFVVQDAITVGLVSAQVGAVQQFAAAGAWRHSGNVSERDHGNFVERYVREADRVEQVFVLRTPCAGAITVRSRLATGLPIVKEIAPGEAGWKETDWAGGGLVFTDGVRVVRYYGAKAIDADGRELLLRPRWMAGLVVLTVPAEFVDNAAFPLTIDPWIQLGSSGGSVGVSNAINGVSGVALAVDAAGNPNIAWLADDGTGVVQVYFRRWNGTSWVELAGSGSGTGLSGLTFSATSVSLTLDGSGNPQVAWSGLFPVSASSEVLFRRWNGALWQELAASGTGEGITIGGLDAVAPSVVVDATGNPAIAFQRSTGAEDQIYLLNWTGAAWAELAGSNSGNGISSSPGETSIEPSLAANAAGKLAVAWTSLSGSNLEVRYREFNAAGPSWDPLGGSGTGGGVSATATHSRAPSLALETGGNPVISWYELVVEYAIHLRRWTGAAWAELGGSATGSGISGPNQFGYFPSLALDASNNPRVAWEAHLGTLRHAYYREWSGTAWIERDGSASGAGVDGRAGDVNAPRLAVTATGVPAIAWTETQAYVRLNSGTTFTALTQNSLDGTSLAVGATTTESSVKFRGAFSGDTFQWRLQIEAKPVGIAFSDLPMAESPLLLPGQTAEIALPLSNGDYHWQARAITEGGSPTGWSAFGGNAETVADVTVSFAVGATTINNFTTTKRKCGMLGFEVLLLVLLLRRRR